MARHAEYRLDPERHRRYQREFIKRHPEKVRRSKRMAADSRREFMCRIKEMNPCADCTVSFPHYVMQFDHVRGAKLFNVSALASGGWPTFLKELAKCEVVCANCHAIRTHQRGQLKRGRSDAHKAICEIPRAPAVSTRRVPTRAQFTTRSVRHSDTRQGTRLAASTSAQRNTRTARTSRRVHRRSRA